MDAQHDEAIAWQSRLGAMPGDSPAAGLPRSDPLTGLADRRGLTQRLQEALGNSAPAHRDVVVIAVGIHGLRRINTLHGGTVGDQVLRITAERLVAGIRSSELDGEGRQLAGADLVGRIDAGEFAVICGIAAPAAAEADAVAARLLRLVERPIAVGGQLVRPDAYAGVVRTLPEHRQAEDVLRDLDLALQRAKALGPGKAITWRQAMTSAAIQHYSLSEQLRQAADNGEFVLHYQPVMRLADHRMVGAEALLRWNHPSDGLIASAAFMPVLEETGLIVDIGNWVVREAVRQVQSWHMLYGRHIVDWVSVNLSARQFDDAAGLQEVLRTVDGEGFSLHRLMLEITTTALMRDPASGGAVLDDLRSRGVRIAIDDFGTGGFSLHRLPRGPLDMIKIDREIVAQIGSADGETLLQAVLRIAQIYSASIVAEGVETAAQRDFLRDAGCRFGQGYFFAQPMDGALLGAYALTHGADDSKDPARGRLAG